MSIHNLSVDENNARMRAQADAWAAGQGEPTGLQKAMNGLASGVELARITDRANIDAEFRSATEAVNSIAIRYRAAHARAEAAATALHKATGEAVKIPGRIGPAIVIGHAADWVNA